MIDVRAIANEILDRADELSLDLSNMALNKVVYFVHCDYLLEHGEALISAKIEAWQHGPVFREIYHEFKRWADQPIRSRATKVNPHSGEVEIARVAFGFDERKSLTALIDRYIRFTAAQLRALSHAAGGPWDTVWEHSGRANPGMQITNELIRESYQTEVRQ